MKNKILFLLLFIVGCQPIPEYTIETTSFEQNCVITCDDEYTVTKSDCNFGEELEILEEKDCTIKVTQLEEGRLKIN